MEAIDSGGRYRLTALSAGSVTVVASSGSGMRSGGSDRKDEKTVSLADVNAYPDAYPP